MSTTNYVYAGASARNIGRFGLVQPGDVLALNDAEALTAADNPSLVLQPTRQKKQIKVTGSVTLGSSHRGKIVKCNHSADMTATLPTSPTSADNFEIFFGDAADPTKVVNLDPGSNAIDSSLARYKASAGVPVAAGSGYLPADTITLTGGTFSTAAIFTVATVKGVSAVVHAAGSGYQVGDVITLSGGTSTTALQFTVDTVSTGAIATGHISTAGAYSAVPATHTAVTGGHGTGAQLDITWGVLTVTVGTAGNYSIKPTNPVAQGSTSGAGTGATFTTTFIGAVYILTATLDSVGVYWDGAKWAVF